MHTCISMQTVKVLHTFLHAETSFQHEIYFIWDKLLLPKWQKKNRKAHLAHIKSPINLSQIVILKSFPRQSTIFVLMYLYIYIPVLAAKYQTFHCLQKLQNKTTIINQRNLEYSAVCIMPYINGTLSNKVTMNWFCYNTMSFHWW